jgi:hypothetical protein
MVRKQEQDLVGSPTAAKSGNSRVDSSSKTTLRARASATARRPQYQACLGKRREASHHNDASNIILTPATAVTLPTTVTPTTPMMPAAAVTPEEAKTPAAAANEFCGDSQKILKMAKSHSAYTKYKPKLIPLLLSI